MRRTVFAMAAVLITGTMLWSNVGSAEKCAYRQPAVTSGFENVIRRRHAGRQVDTPGNESGAYVISRFKESGIPHFGTSYEAPFTFTGRGANAAERHGVNIVGRIEGTKPRRLHRRERALITSVFETVRSSTAPTTTLPAPRRCSPWVNTSRSTNPQTPSCLSHSTVKKTGCAAHRL